MSARVAIIGAGPCGLAQLHAYVEAEKDGAEIPELVCFEKQSDWGGLWNYTWRTGLDRHGEPVHGSMYRYLWSNGPKECLELADYTFDEHFEKPIPSFPPREVLADYVLGRAERDDLRRFVRFDTAVRHVRYDASAERFTLLIEDLEAREERSETFDYVVVASGHFSVPHVPDYPGFAEFPGRILHSHDFRDAREFSDKDLLVLGSSYSAEDIALQTKKYGARSVTIAYRHAPMGFDWPDGVDEVPALQRLEGRTAHFADGTNRAVDAILLCTGYQHSLGFIDTSMRLATANVLYPPSLYQGIFWYDNPRLMYLGMQDQYYTFTMFDSQAFYARDYVLGRIKLPDQATREADIAAWRERLDECDGQLDEIDFQAAYIAELDRATDYPDYDLQMTQDHFKTWEHHKAENIVTYRDQGFASPCTGTPAPVHHTKWWVEMDDSMSTFLATRDD